MLSFECWDEWAAYDEETDENSRATPDRFEPADFGLGELTGVIDL